MCITSVVDFFQRLLRLSCGRRLPEGQQLSPEPRTSGSDDMPARRRLGDVPSTTPAPDAGCAVTFGGLNLSELNDEVLLQILNHLPGWMGTRAEVTGLAAWKREALGDAWWQTRCRLEFSASRRTGEESWRKHYRGLLGLADAGTGSWCYKSHRHGLGDRVAAPQLFIGPDGQKLFCYGGWTDRGPQTDLHAVPLHAIVEAAQHGEDTEPWRFARAQESGQLPQRGGVATLTPLWYGEEATSAEHLRATARELQRLSGTPTAEGNALVMTFGGAGGGYRHEHNGWSIGLLQEGEGDAPSSILWGRPRSGSAQDLEDAGGLQQNPLPRCAHSATFIPARLAGADFPEGCVAVFGGHTHHCTESLASIDILCLCSWQWRAVPFIGKSDVLPEDWQMQHRHGHSATLFELDGKGYLVVVGGGTGNILENWGVRDFGDLAVLALEPDSWRWIGHYSFRQDQALAVPGRHHTACKGLGGKLLLMGGGRRPGRQVCVVDAERCIRRALCGDVIGQTALRPIPHQVPRPGEDQGAPAALPLGRKMHGAVCLAPWAPLLVIYGGWETGPHFSDVWTFAIGGSAEDIEDYQTLSEGGEAEEEEEDEGGDEGSRFVGLRMLGPDGQVRFVRVPPELLAQFVRQGIVRPAGGAPPAAEGSGEEEEEEED